MIRPLKIHHDYFMYKSFPMAYSEIGRWESKAGNRLLVRKEGQQRAGQLREPELNSSSLSYKCIYKMSAQAERGSVQTAG